MKHASIIYPRDLKEKIKPYFKRKEIIAIKGPRQAGKTTLMKDLYQELSQKKKCLYLTFEKRDDLEVFDKDIESFKKIYIEDYEIIFIDEFQYAENGGQKLKYLFDTTKTKFIISGSSSLELTSQTGKYLVGRLFSFDLYPFSFSEFLRVKNQVLLKLTQSASQKLELMLAGKTNILPQKEPIKAESLKKKFNKLLEEYIIFGGYPEVILSAKKEEKRQILKGILETYLLRDIKSLLDLATDEELIHIAKFLSLQLGNLVVYQELSSAAGLSFSQLKKHLKILKETYILELISPYCRNKRTELSKNPKIHFLDTGFRNMLIDDFSSLNLRTDAGALFEGFVFTQLKRKIEAIGGIKFWRTKSQAEVDFIIEKGEEVLPIEVKSSLKEKLKIGKSFHSFLKKYQPKQGVIITKSFWGQRVVGNSTVYFFPAFYL